VKLFSLGAFSAETLGQMKWPVGKTLEDIVQGLIETTWGHAYLITTIS
jgi:hypothetical protein